MSAGFAASAGRGLYGASKSAVEAITEALHAELAPLNPVQAVVAIRRLAAIAEPPLRLQLGSDCVNLVESKLASVVKELGQWRGLALSTDFKPA